MSFCSRCTKQYPKKYNQTGKLCSDCWTMSKDRDKEIKLLYWDNFDDLRYFDRRAPSWVKEELAVRKLVRDNVVVMKEEKELFLEKCTKATKELFKEKRCEK